MTDEDITKLASQLTESLATKEDLESLATKEDLESLATKEDVTRLATKEDLERLENKLEGKIDEVDKKVDVILTYVDGVNETVDDHEKRLKKIENIPVIAHNLK